MKIRVLFYKAQKDGHMVDDGISLWTKLFNWNTPPYSHVEIWWPDKIDGFDKACVPGRATCECSGGTTTVTMDYTDTEYCGRCFTSTMRGEDNGTVLRSANEVLTHPKRWDYIEITVAEEDALTAKGLARLAAQANSGYDFFCILGFFLPFRVRSKEKNICSEAVQKFLVWCKVFPKKKIWSPRRLSKQLDKLGYTTTSLWYTTTSL